MDRVDAVLAAPPDVDAYAECTKTQGQEQREMTTDGIIQADRRGADDEPLEYLAPASGFDLEHRED